MARVFGAFALLAIGIALSGLAGMTHLAHQRRAREVAIRKTFGAPTSSLAALLARETAAPLGAALAVGLPAGWLLARGWLGGFAYAVAPLPIVLLVTGLLVLALSAFAGALIRRALGASPILLLHSR
jgi:putative ABC transport system permease protein